ncbi:MAG TPA: YjbH domain-containing protein [Lunatimonas sp.]|nr:YjbH domain-containing protein [Lunatimonas sp.]
MPKINCWAILVLCLVVGSLQAQELKEKLWDAGFEQIHVLEGEDTVTIFFEHRLFRTPNHSLTYAGLVANEARHVVWVPLYHNRPMGVYEGNDLRYRTLENVEREAFKARNNLSRGYRFHFRIMPDFSARFGNFEQPFQTKTNVILDTRIYLLPGLSLHSGVLFPLENSLDAQEMNIRVAPSHLHYFVELLPSHFLSLTGGLFHYDRYGIDLQYRYSKLDKPWSIGLESGYTGYYFLPPGSIYTESPEDISLVMDMEYRLPFENLSIRLSGGQFLFRDRGVRGDLIKQFAAVEVGFHSALTQAGFTAGFQVAFPLFPGKILRGKKVELRTTEEFRWEYTYNNEATVARQYRLGIPRLADQLRQYNSLFIRSFK